MTRLAAELSRAQGEVVELRTRLETTEARLRRTESELAAATSGGVWAVTQVARRLVHRVAPPGTGRSRMVARAGRLAVVLVTEGWTGVWTRRLRRGLDGVAPPPLSWDEQYRLWLARNRPDADALDRMAAQVRGWDDRHEISVVMPVYDPEPAHLQAAIDSLHAQVYDRWELCIADDGSRSAEVQRLLNELSTDRRVRIHRRSKHGGIAAASNDALALARGEWVAFLDHDDVLEPHALYHIVEHLRQHPDTDVVYTDEDKLFPDGSRGEPFFKPDWSPDLLLATNYLCHLTVVRRRLVIEVGGFREGFDGSQDHDLFLRVTERARSVGHVSLPLYSWRRVPGSAAASTAAKPQAYVAGMRAVADALQRRGVEARVEPGPSPGRYHVRRHLRHRPAVAVVVPTRDRVDLLAGCVAAVERSGYRPLEVIIVDNDSRHPATLAWLEGCGHRVLRCPGPFNFSSLVNAGVAATEAEHVVLLNNDVEAREPGWIEAMLEQSQRPEVGAVGARLLYPDGRPQHEGVSLGVDGPAENIDATGYFDLGRVVREVAAVTAACMMCRRQVFAVLGGFDETLMVAFNDVDFCLRARLAGYRIVYTPLATLVHREGASRGRAHPGADERCFVERWGPRGYLRDPYVSPHLASFRPVRLRLG